LEVITVTTAANAERLGELSASGEDYLEAIYQLGGPNNSVRSVDLADKLDVSKASVNKAVNKLKAAGLILQPHYGDITLTKSGLLYARGVQSRHEILSQFLEEVLGVDPVIAQEEACLMEHAISDDTLARWIEFMEGQRAARPAKDDSSQ
jgi:Mn-dependent DtxR family transcriptional regulator